MSYHFIKRASATITAVALMATTGMSAFAAQTSDKTNNTSTKNDLANQDVWDLDKKGSITIYKYDTTAAEAAGDYTAGDHNSNGEADTALQNAMSDYAIQGVEFTYLRLGNVEQHISTKNGTETYVELVYEVPTALATLLGLDEEESTDADDADSSEKNQNYSYGSYVAGTATADSGAENMTQTTGTAVEGDDQAANIITEGNPCTNTGVLHYTAQQLNDAMKDLLEKDSIATKNALEEYIVANGGVAMTETNASGYTGASNLDLGLYLIVETKVPEMITSTVNPWLVSLPFTNESYEENQSDSGISYDTDDEKGGNMWLYDITCYPKNETGNPTLDKSVRNAYNNNTDDLTDANFSIETGDYYVNGNASDALVVYNAETNTTTNTADTSDALYVANRGGYTSDGTTAGKGGAGYSTDFTYDDTTTASEGDLLDYIIVSKLPHISSEATYLTQYSFKDVLSIGQTFNNDVRIAFYDNAIDAAANNTANAEVIWDASGENFASDWVRVETVSASNQTIGTTINVTFTADGLKLINGENVNGNITFSDGDVATGGDDSSVHVGTQGELTGLHGMSDHYMVVYYTATLNSDAQAVLGDSGNPNDVTLTWSRTSDKDKYYNQLEDRTYVYSYGLDLTKTFTDGTTDFSAVEFKLYNATDAYYVVAKKAADGVYYVTGKAVSEYGADATTAVNGTQEDDITDSEGNVFDGTATNRVDTKDDAATCGTTFVPGADGKLIIYGLEGDTYELTEVATADGYSILKDAVEISIVPTERDIIPSVAGAIGLEKGDDADDYANIIDNYNGGIANSWGENVDDAEAALTADTVTDSYATGAYGTGGVVAEEEANGRTIGKTSMYESAITPAYCLVNGVHSTIEADLNHTDSENAMAVIGIANSPAFLLPVTGGNGLYAVTIISAVAIAAGCYVKLRKKNEA